MLSGTPFDYDCLQDEFFPKAWAGNTPLKQLKKDGYQVRLYVDMNTLIGDRKQLIGSVDNLSTSKRHIPYGRLLGQMYKLTAYRNMPHCLKPAFWLYTEDINAVDQDGYAILDDVFFEQLTTQKLSFSDEDKSFILYHLNGTHGTDKHRHYQHKRYGVNAQSLQFLQISAKKFFPFVGRTHAFPYKYTVSAKRFQ